ncbi:YqjF family protein [Paenibacillus macquariensis]|uniref:DUF2071 domain-containing protein n=1 Tax=Paenibacillus macquariensis TaxID=948756 RepID=A0ABY1KD06_9BACL|nr:DUF2071 domain-containing protein [Paenibacillus macquariensis]MEC0093197.1 DUF2071 domain-containing protein [Paenibacillus macquariensis]OAB35058.1 hypothetical protein PMSM_10760 [Paenibacillus macquariensis subsp. macquariensis]SIR62679.1 hypothetical protein SAMN05421578_12426 [Paenibacillus macquariensis]
MIVNSKRPWPAPSSPWIIKQSWRDLLFLHYPVKADALRPHVPIGMDLDTFNDHAWISVVPFEMSGIRFKGTPPAPYLSNFPELNVRTYVTVGSKPGVYFFSLDAKSLFGVFFGKKIYKLPYYYSNMSIERQTDHKVIYESSRKEDHFTFKASYQPISEIYHAVEGTLDYWLVERYCLYGEHRSQILMSEINHQPWNLQKVAYDVRENSMIQLSGIEVSEPLCAHYCENNDVHVWPLKSTEITNKAD